MGKTHNKFTMESLGQDCLDVHEFHRRRLLRDREVVIKPLLRWPRVVQIRVSRYRILVEQTHQFWSTSEARSIEKNFEEAKR